MKRPQPPAEYTIARFAQLIGADRHTLAKRLEEMETTPAGKSPGQRAKVYRLKDLVAAHVGGDERAERIRKTRAEALRLELANARSQGELVEAESVKRLGQKVLIAVRNRILNMPLTDEEKDGCLRELLALGDMDWSRDA